MAGVSLLERDSKLNFSNMGSTKGGNRLSLKASYDTRKFPLCAPFDGSRGDDFLSFERDFTAAIADEADEYSSLLECLPARH